MEWGGWGVGGKMLQSFTSPQALKSEGLACDPRSADLKWHVVQRLTSYRELS